jgi:hypothetical protein
MYRHDTGLIKISDLEIALNYGQATGAAQLLRFVTEHTEVGSVQCLTS